MYHFPLVLICLVVVGTSERMFPRHLRSVGMCCTSSFFLLVGVVFSIIILRAVPASSDSLSVRVEETPSQCRSGGNFFSYEASLRQGVLTTLW